MITLPRLNHHCLNSVATVWRETTYDLIKWAQMVVLVFLIYCFQDQIDVVVETYQISTFNHLNFVAEGLLKVELGWVTVKEDLLHVCIIIGQNMASNRS